MIKPRDGREMALKFLFCQEFLLPEDFELPIEGRIVKFQSSFKAQEQVWQIMRKIVIAYTNHQKEIDHKLVNALESWKLDRLSLTDKNILRIAITEMVYLETPPKVALDEALELGKKYSAQDSASFINGILDNILNNDLT